MDAEYVLSALLRHNYLPAHKADLTEVPPLFSTETLTNQVACDLAASGGRQGGCGYDVIRYLSTRFNKVPRVLSVPHPVAHSRLALCISDNWDEIKWITSNPNSFIKPRLHPDGRLVIMDYGSGSQRAIGDIRRGFGKRFRVKADISNCYPSIYTHSIPWAAVGRPAAKVRRRDDEWFNLLDKRAREAKRGETHGIVIGPATSSIICEFVLGRVDEALRDCFSHCRFVDDFTADCATEEEALRFLQTLAARLREFNLELNARKTEVASLPVTSTPCWVHELSLWSPRRDTLTASDITNYLDLALSMTAREPDGSVLKYAIKAIRRRPMRDSALFALISYTLSLAYHNPVLLPLLDQMFDKMAELGYPLNYEESINTLISHFSSTRCADGLAWALHYADREGFCIDNTLAPSILECGDCLSLCQLWRNGSGSARLMVQELVAALVGGVVTEVDKYELDQYWMLLYELYADGKIQNPYKGEDAFQIMSTAGVRFMRAP